MESEIYSGLKPEDRQFFNTLFDEKVDETKLSKEEIKKRRVLSYLLKIKNGIPPVRKNAIRQLTDKSKFFGPSILFSQIIPLLMSPSLDDEERHSLVKLMERLLLKLGVAVSPWAHKILVAVTPMLMDDIPYVRIEGPKYLLFSVS
jgi:splicing factor 3B subunit 1